MDKLNEFIDMVIHAIDTRQNKKPKPMVTQAEVLRVEGDTVWVHIPGGVPETPVKRTIDCKKGDTVQVRVSTPSVIVGNNTHPPTDDTVAKVAQESADDAARIAGEAKDEAGKTKSFFWYLNGDSDEAGAHITEIPGEEFRENPKGPNVFIKSTGLFLRIALKTLLGIITNGLQIFEPTDSTHPSAQFLSTGTVIGKETGAHVVVTGDKVEFYLGSFLIGYIEPAGSYLEISSSGRNLAFTNIASSGQGNYCDIDMDNGHMDLTATQDFKFNANKMLNTFTATGTVSLNSGSGGNCSVSGTVPTGYTPIAVQSLETEHNQTVLIGKFVLSSTGASVTLRNVGGSNYSNMTVTATILCINSSLL